MTEKFPEAPRDDEAPTDVEVELTDVDGDDEGVTSTEEQAARASLEQRRVRLATEKTIRALGRGRRF